MAINLSSIPNYYTREDSFEKGYRQLLFRAGLGLQSAELNEWQEITKSNMTSLFDSLYSTGTVIRGGGIVMSGAEVVLSDATVYVSGLSIDAPSRTLYIDTEGVVVLGVRIDYEYVTDEYDGELLDPAVGTANEGQAGSYRLKITGTWCRSTDIIPSTSDFYSVYTIEDGELQTVDSISPELTSMRELIARYDKASNGSYVSEGCQVTYKSYNEDDNTYKFSVNAGTCNVDGYQLINQFARTIYIEGVTEYSQALSEPFVYVSGTDTYTTRFANIKAITRLVMVREYTQTLTHSSYSNGSDALTYTPVIEILSVVQGSTTYTQGLDYVQNGNSIDWSPSGEEPNPDSTYQVTYTYYQTVTSGVTISEDKKSFTLPPDPDNGAKIQVGSILQLDYEYYLSRIDRIVINSDNTISIMTGSPDYSDPQAPQIPKSGLSLATVLVSYGVDPVVTNSYIKAYTMSDIATMQGQIDELMYNVARLSLIEDIRGTDPSTNKLNLFADPLYDDDLRDAGIEQTAIILDYQLQLPIELEVVDVYTSGIYTLLPYSREEYSALSQEVRTGSRKINEFLNAGQKVFELTLDPQIYSYIAKTEQVDAVVENYHGWRGTITETSVQNINDTVETLPPTQIKLTVDGYFNPYESIEVYFDDEQLPNITADATGEIKNVVITTPTGATSGMKKIVILGATTGFTASQVFTSIPQVQTVTVTVYKWYDWDPLAETFTRAISGYITSVFVMFAVQPTSTVKCHITETTAGTPLRDQVLTSSIMQPEDIPVNTWVEFVFENPCYIASGTEYAISFESSDSVGELYIAKIGERSVDTLNYVLSQPYADGVLLGSSNASTWTAYQDEDLQFKTTFANFSTTGTGVLGTVSVTDATDLILSMGYETLVGTTVIFTVTFLDDADTPSYNVVPGQLFSFALYTGRIQLSYTLTTTNTKISPVLDLTAQMAIGHVSETGTYVSRAFSVDGTTLTVYLEEYRGSASNVNVYYQKDTDTWIQLTRDDSATSAAANSMVECVYKASDLNVNQTRIKIELTTTDVTQRPRVASIRASVSP